MLKDHKSAMHLEGVTFDKVIRNSNETEQFLNFLLFYNCQLEIIKNHFVAKVRFGSKFC